MTTVNRSSVVCRIAACRHQRSVAIDGELGIVVRRTVDEPAPAGGVDIDGDCVADGCPEHVAVEIRNDDTDAVQERHLLVSETGIGPAPDCLGDGPVASMSLVRAWASPGPVPAAATIGAVTILVPPEMLPKLNPMSLVAIAGFLGVL